MVIMNFHFSNSFHINIENIIMAIKTVGKRLGLVEITTTAYIKVIGLRVLTLEDIMTQF